MKPTLTFVPALLVSLGLLAACKANPADVAALEGGASSKPASAPKAQPIAKALPELPQRPQIPAPSDVAAPPADAVKTASGLASKVLTPPTGKELPGPTDTVEVRYTGWTKDGKTFDSTDKEPAKFRLDQVIPGWTEAVQLMKVGEKRRFWIPAALAYGEQPRGGAPAGDLTFEIELLSITPGPKPPEVPEDVKAAPASAKKTASGLAYRVLQAGKGTRSPKETDRVQVHYSGWTTDGKMFDSSVMRGAPASFALNRVIKGWTEGVQLMHEGDKYRFWIPGELAYGDTPKRPGAPAGMLVFDVELLSVQQPPAAAPVP